MKNNINSTTPEGGPTVGTAALPSKQNEEGEAAATASPMDDNPAGEHELNGLGESINLVMDVTTETDVGTTKIEASPLIRDTATKDETCSKTESVGRFTPEMRQWLSDSGEAYEFYLLHAVLHDPLWRAKMVAIPGLQDDFFREEYRLVMGAVSSAEGILGDMNRSLPTPPSCEFLRTHIESAARQVGSEDEIIAGAHRLVSELQDPKFNEMHYCVPVCFEAWYSSSRAKRMARELMMHKVPEVSSILEGLQDELFAASQINGSLDDCEFDFDNEPEVPEPILKLGEYPLCTRGNISNIQGPPKAGKSAVVEAILASSISYRYIPITGDTLGFEARCHSSYAVIHIDTEQSEYDHHALVRRSHKRARRWDRVEQFHSYLLTGHEPTTCWDFLLRKLGEALRKHGGVSLVILDGIADFCRDPNDGEACFDLVRKLQKLALDYDCAIITVLHENPSSSFGKTRGHLGSQIERKSETMLRLSKDLKTGVFEMWTERSRHCFIPKKAAMRFEWNDKAKMHLTLWDLDRSVDASTEDRDAKYAKEIEKVFRDQDEFSYTELWKRISNAVGISESTAKGRIKTYGDLNLIEKHDDGKYDRTRSESSA